MKDKIESCVLFRDRRSRPSVTEKGKTFQLDNIKKMEVACVKVDNCVFKQEDGIKCDFLFEIADVKKIYYVELKGSDIIKAINQISTTLQQTRNIYPDWNLEARIIAGGKVPSSISNRSEYEKLRGNCKGGTLTVYHKNIHLEPLE